MTKSDIMGPLGYNRHRRRKFITNSERIKIFEIPFYTCDDNAPLNVVIMER
jgi:hypothetical protein